MIKVIRELDLKDFEAWAGGKAWLDEIKEKGLVDYFQNLIEEYWPDGVDEYTLNSYLWFDAPEELERLEEEEKEDEEEDEE